MNTTRFDGRLCGLRVTKALELAFRAIAEEKKIRILDLVRLALAEYVIQAEAEAEDPPTQSQYTTGATNV